MEKSELYYHVAYAHLQEQDQRAQSLELRASGAMGLGIALLGVASLILNTAVGQNAEFAVRIWGLVATCGAAFIAVLACGIKAQYPSDQWRRDPDLSKFKEYLPQYADATLVEWAGDQFSNSITTMKNPDDQGELRRGGLWRSRYSRVWSGRLDDNA